MQFALLCQEIKPRRGWVHVAGQVPGVVFIFFLCSYFQDEVSDMAILFVMVGVEY